MRSGHRTKGDSVKKSFFMSKKFMLIVFVFFFASAALVSWLVIQNDKSRLANDKNSGVSKLDQEIMSTAQNYNKSNNIEEAAKAYDDTIKKTDDLEKKSQIMIAKSAIYLNSKDYVTALDIAKQAVETYGGFDSYQHLAQVYEAMKNYEDAIINYEKTLEYINKDDFMADNDIEYIQNTIIELKKLNNEVQ